MTEQGQRPEGSHSHNPHPAKKVKTGNNQQSHHSSSAKSPMCLGASRRQQDDVAGTRSGGDHKASCVSCSDAGKTTSAYLVWVRGTATEQSPRWHGGSRPPSSHPTLGLRLRRRGPVVGGGLAPSTGARPRLVVLAAVAASRGAATKSGLVSLLPTAEARPRHGGKPAH